MTEQASIYAIFEGKQWRLKLFLNPHKHCNSVLCHEKHTHSMWSPFEFPFAAESVHPVHRQRETHHCHHDWYGRHKVTQRGGCGRLDSDELGRGIIADRSVQHTVTPEITLSKKERQRFGGVTKRLEFRFTVSSALLDATISASTVASDVYKRAAGSQIGHERRLGHMMSKASELEVQLKTTARTRTFTISRAYHAFPSVC